LIKKKVSVKDVIEISGKVILPGENLKIKSKIARLPSGTEIEVPAYVYRSAQPGPVVLLSGGLHGDEINGIEIVRRMLESGTFDNLLRGSVVAVPVMNIYGFLNFSRDVPDGKDINRSFPGHITGSLAARFAHFLTEAHQGTITLR
jgi:predicted deacylase